MSNDYPLTIADVKAFLATKEEDGPIGIACNAKYCLLSETLNWKYPSAAPWSVNCNSYHPGDFREPFYLLGSVYAVRRAFDMPGSTIHGRYTKFSFREKMRLVAEEGLYALQFKELFDE